MGKIHTIKEILKNDPRKITIPLAEKMTDCFLFRIVPDRMYLKILYRLYFWKKLNLKNPKTFNEKIQWLKINDRNPIYSKFVDKIAVKKYIESLLGQEYIIPNLGIWDSFDDIDFNTLPEKFVLKCSHDSGSVIICHDKSELNIEKAKNMLSRKLKSNLFWYGREWPYQNIKPKIIAEKLLENNNSEILDYKFFCFNGKCKCLYISKGSHNKDQCIQFYDREFKPMECERTDYMHFLELPSKPKNFEKMIELAEFISKDLIHLRVDFYEIEEKIYIGELTLYTGSGFIPFSDEKYDLFLGDMMDIQCKNN